MVSYPSVPPLDFVEDIIRKSSQYRVLLILIAVPSGNCRLQFLSSKVCGTDYRSILICDAGQKHIGKCCHSHTIERYNSVQLAFSKQHD